MTPPEHPDLPALQAPVKAMDPHGVLVISFGTGVFALASLLCWWQLPALEAGDDGWWLSTATTGTAIGALALIVLLGRRRMRSRRPH